MIRFLHRLLMLAIAASVIVGSASAQTRKPYDLALDFGLGEMQSMLQVKNLVPDTNAAKQKWPRFWQRRAAIGYRAAHFMDLSAFDAAWGEAVWQGHGGGQPISGYLSSTNHVKVPKGTYYQTIIAEVSAAEYTGAGSGYSAVNNNSVNTQLVIWHEAWQGDPMERHCMRSGNWGRLGNLGYLESVIIKGFRLTGRSHDFPGATFNSCGLQLWKPGELSTTDDIYAHDFRSYGIEVHAPTPHHFRNISVFDNVLAGIGLSGSWGGTVQIDMLSGDDNSYMVASVPGYGLEAGGTVNIDTLGLHGNIKAETGVASADRVHRGMNIGRLFGQFAFNIGAISYASGAITVDAVFVVDARLTNGTMQASRIRVGAMKGFNYKTLVHDIGNQKRWPAPANYSAVGFEYTSAGGGQLYIFGQAQTAQSIRCSDRLGFIQGSGNFDYSNCSPPFRYLVDGPPRAAAPVYLDQPSTGTWSCTAYPDWSTVPCVNGKQTRTRTCTCLPAGATCPAKPGEQESQDCSTPVDVTKWPVQPKDLLVVYNDDDPDSKAIGDAELAAWTVGGQTPKVLRLRLGNQPTSSATSTTITSLRNQIRATGAKVAALCWVRPHAVGVNNAITYALQNGLTTASWGGSTTPTYAGYPAGNHPSGTVLCTQVNHVTMVERSVAAHGLRPGGALWMVCSNDQSGCPRCTPRKADMESLASGSMASLLPQGVTVGYQNTCASTTCGKGEQTNGCNYLLNKQNVLGHFGSMYKVTGLETNTWVPGAYYDQLTSTSGALPTGTGQTPITAATDRLASCGTGSISEPNTALADKFVDIDIFVRAYYVDGLSFAQAVWRSVRRPAGLLMVGDPMMAPYAQGKHPGGGVIPPDPPPTGGSVIATYDNFSNANPNASFPVTWVGVKRIRFQGLTVTSSPNFQRLAYLSASDAKGLRVTTDGKWRAPDGSFCTQLPAAFVPGTYATAEIVLTNPVDIGFLLSNKSNGAAWQFSCVRMEVLRE